MWSLMKLQIFSTISTHTLTWSVTGEYWNYFYKYDAFQLTRSRGAWRTQMKQNFKKLSFQLTRSCGAWHLQFSKWHLYFIFQLTRSRGAWQIACISLSRCYYFNSHAHVERDKINYFIKNSFIISTHTLTWSVTCIYADWIVKICISTHTLTWSVTCFLFLYVFHFKFQLTRSRGAWRH